MNAKKAIQKINCNKIEIGMRVVELDCPWIESPFTVHGFKIRNDDDIQRLQQSCNYIYISPVPKPDADTVTISGRPNSNLDKQISAAISSSRPQHYADTISLEQALPEAKKTHSMARKTVRGFLDNIRLGQDFDTSAAKEVVRQCVESVIANPKALFWLGLLKNVDEYTAQHSCNVGLLSIILGREEGLTSQQLEVVGMCGLMHDMGKAEIPLEILNKEGAFTKEEFEIMKAHTTKGYQLLKQKNDLETIVCEVAHAHHERLNGRGYPQALTPKDISYYTRIVAIADTYDAITSQRVYSKAKTPLEALTILMGARDSHYDKTLVQSFVKCIGSYPAGAIAELSSKEVGIVLPSSDEIQAPPRVLVVRDENHHECMTKLVDLGQNPVDRHNNLLRIRNLLSEDTLDISLSQYHDEITELMS